MSFSFMSESPAAVILEPPNIKDWNGTGMGEFNADDHYIYYCGQESLRRMENSSKRNEEAEPKQKQCLVVDVTGDGSKVQCYKEQ